MSGGRTIALTGATGFVGRAVLDAAAEQGAAVRALTRRPQLPRKGVTWVEGSLETPAALAELVAGAGAVLHVAGLTNAPDARGFGRANVNGTAAMLRAAKEADVRRFVFVSSLSAREPQLSDYGASKRRAEALVAASGLDWTIVRPPAVYGPRDTEMFELFRAARWGVVPLPPRGRASLIAGADLARLLLALAASDDERLGGAIYEPDDGQPGGYAHTQLARLLGAAVGRRAVGLHLPKSLLTLAARTDRLLRGGKAKLTRDRVGYMIHPDWACDPVRAVPPEVWIPRIRAAEGLAATARWYRENGWF